MKCPQRAPQQPGSSDEMVELLSSSWSVSALQHKVRNVYLSKKWESEYAFIFMLENIRNTSFYKFVLLCIVFVFPVLTGNKYGKMT